MGNRLKQASGSLPSDYIDRIVSSITASVPTEKIYLFGSYARGEQTPDSDIDLYVITKDREKKAFDWITEARMALRWMRPRERDVLCATNDSFNAKLKNPLSVESAVKREGVLIYG